MDGDKDSRDPGVTDFTTESSWPLDSDSDYFFTNESTVLGEFGWNFNADDPIVGADDDMSDLAGSSSTTPVDQNNSRSSSVLRSSVEPEPAAPVIGSAYSTSSSEDRPEWSTDSGDKPPPETPSSTSKVNKKKGQKQIRQPQFAFMTKSDVDHLEDGYRWRKYGQKAVKNSPYPRSYYRCTNSKCMVKKRVERSSEDPTTVITTYEGQHCHHTAPFPRGGGGGVGGGVVNIISHGQLQSGFAATSPVASQSTYYPTSILPRSQISTTHSSTIERSPSTHQPVQAGDTHRHHDQAARGSQGVINPDEPLPLVPVPTDEGLLGDIVPSGMRNPYDG